MAYSSFDIYMKQYESVEAQKTLLPGLPICVRLDGRAFHTVTKKCLKPFDPQLREVMNRVVEDLIEECDAVLGYTQSDEITLVLKPMNKLDDYYFKARIQKLCSMLASVASVSFNTLVRSDEFKDNLGMRITKQAYFDCRVWNVPNMAFAAMVFSWRQADSIKNSISMVAQSHFSHSELLSKNSDEKIDMLANIGVSYHSYPAEYRQGVFVKRVLVTRKYTVDELEQLPEKHAARQCPDLMVTRSEYRRFAGEELRSIQNQAEYLFDGADPVFRELDYRGKYQDSQTPTP